jgi:lipopolysaccharide transport system permease protein
MAMVIRAQKKSFLLDLKELWAHRELLFFFTWRDLKIRYKQTVVGVAWAIFQPLLTMIIFTIFFGEFAKIPSDNIPYPIFVYSGLLLWQLFSSTVLQASNSLVANQNLLTKVYFPRILLPISTVFSNLVDFAIASVILVGLMIYYGYVPSFEGILIFPLLILGTAIFSVGLGLFLSSLNVKYRDVKYVLPYFMQMLLFVTPVIYPPSILGAYSWILALNPMTGIIKAARGALFGAPPINWLLLAISLAVALAVFAFAFWYFKKTERYFADLI